MEILFVRPTFYKGVRVEAGTQKEFDDDTAWEFIAAKKAIKVETDAAGGAADPAGAELTEEQIAAQEKAQKELDEAIAAQEEAAKQWQEATDAIAAAQKAGDGKAATAAEKLQGKAQKAVDETGQAVVAAQDKLTAATK